NARTATLGHFLAADSNEAVHIQRVWRLQAGELQHGRPEQGVKVDDVLADEMHLLGVAFRVDQAVEIEPRLFTVSLERRQVSDRGVQADVEILARSIWNRYAEIGFVAGDVPVGQIGFGARLTQPLTRLSQYFRLQALVAIGVGARHPLTQKFHAARVGQPEK